MEMRVSAALEEATPGNDGVALLRGAGDESNHQALTSAASPSPLSAMTPVADTGLADAYSAQCRRFGMQVDPTVATWLRFGGESLQVSEHVPFDACLLPVFDFIVQSKTLRRLSLFVPGAYHARGSGNANARVLRHVLAANDTLQVLDLRSAGIDPEGLADLCQGLRRNSALRELHLNGNFLGHEGGELLGDAVSEMLQQGRTNLQFIDVSNSSLGFQTAQRLVRLTGRRAVDSRSRGAATGTLDVEVKGNFETEELWNAVTHAVMVLASMVGSIVLLCKVAHSPVHHVWGCIIFCFSALFMFLSSTLYHSLFLYPTTTRVFQVFDHIAIFVLIAGSYSPFLLFYPTPAHLALLKVQWILCLLGIVAHILSQYAKWGSSRIYVTGELVLYLVMGWGAVFVWDSLTSQLPVSSYWTLVGGGILYTAGVPFFVMGDYRPIYHTVWHLFVAGAAICHWFSVRDAAADALEHHSSGPFTPNIDWWNERYNHLKDEISNIRQGAHDQGLVRTMHHLQERLDSHALVLTGLSAMNISTALANLSSVGSLFDILAHGWGGEHHNATSGLLASVVTVGN